jgi:hypothetical protein
VFTQPHLVRSLSLDPLGSGFGPANLKGERVVAVSSGDVGEGLDDVAISDDVYDILDSW